MLLKFIQDAYPSPVHLTKVSNTSTCPLSRVPSPFFVLEVQFFWQSIFMCGFINWRTDYVERSVVCIAFQSLNCSVKPPSRGSPNSPQRMCPLPSSVTGVQYYRVSCCLHAGKMLWSPLALPRKPATQLPNSNERIASPKRTSIFPLLPPAIHHSNLLDECSLSFFARNIVDNMLRTQITSFTMETNLEDHINFTTMSAEHLYYGQLNVHCLPLYSVSRICCLASTEVCCTNLSHSLVHFTNFSVTEHSQGIGGQHRSYHSPPIN